MKKRVVHYSSGYGKIFVFFRFYENITKKCLSISSEDLSLKKQNTKKNQKKIMKEEKKAYYEQLKSRKEDILGVENKKEKAKIDEIIDNDDDDDDTILNLQFIN